jgi:hypothetical protein
MFCASASAAAAQNTWTVTSSIGGFTFSAVARGGGATGSDRLQVFVSDALVSNTASQTVTVSNTSDEGNGSIIFVYSISGMSRVGTDAVRQFKVRGPELSTVDLEVTFDAAALTTNPTLVVMSNASSPAGVSPPTNWTENASGDLGYSNPTQGAECAHRDSGFTGTTVTWATNSASAWGAIIVELDASAIHSGSGAATLPLLTADGDGDTESGAATFSGSGAATLPILTASGTGKRSLKGSGTPSLPLLTGSGTGKRALKGSGALSLPLLTAAGTGKKERSGSGAATLPLLTASGSGKKARSGSGAASLPLLDADGTGKRALLGSGEPELPLLTADGEGEVVEPGVSSGSGEATLPLLTASGEGEIVAATPEPPAEERSGGYPPVPDLRDQYEAQRRERLRKLRERDELEERELQREADRLESHLINEGVIQPPDDMARIRALMAQYEAEAVSNRARRAFEYAQRARSQMAYELAEREIQKLQEEEELALLMVIALD